MTASVDRVFFFAKYLLSDRKAIAKLQLPKTTHVRYILCLGLEKNKLKI